MTFCFRVRFNLAVTSALEFHAPKVAFTSDDAVAHQVELACLGTAGPPTITDARLLQIRGSGYDSEAEAEAAGRLWQSRVMWMFASLRVGADFGGRAPHGFLTPRGLELFARPGRRALYDRHGLMVFECEPKPTFLRWDIPTIQFLPRHETLTAAMATAQNVAGLGEREQVAYDLFAASMSGTSEDARFALLMMAVESLIEQDERSEQARAVVDELERTVRDSGLPDNEAKSMLGTLGWLRVESIGQGGRRLAEKLEPSTYMDERPKAFFTQCYELRSRLLHGVHPVPEREEVGRRAAHLHGFVADLLATSISS